MDEIKIVKRVLLGIVLVIVLSTVLGSFGVVDAGERGVKVRLGNIVGTIEPGVYFKLPFIESVKKFNTRTQSVIYEKENPLTAASSDLQDTTISSVTNYHIDASKVADIYVQYKTLEDFEDSVIRPAVRDSIKTASAQFTASELVNKRAEFADRAAKILNEKFADKFIVIEQSNITDVKFSESFTAAIEAKVTAQQNAEAAKNKLEQVKFEQQAQIEISKAQAEKTRLEAVALESAQGEKLIEKIYAEAALKAASVWNGVLPTQMIPGSAVPFIDVNVK